jgi:uncharacterized protein with HEPN domain
VTETTPNPDRFQMTPRREGASRKRPELDRWPAVREALEDLLAECEAITAQGRDLFDAPRSLTYRAAEAVVIHFGDLIESRIPADRTGTIPADLPLPAVKTTRNILSHNYRVADKAIVWAVISHQIPSALRSILAANADDPSV